MNYYDILGVTETSEPEVIEAAYRALMKKYHPDRWTGEAERAENRAKLINEAYTALRSKPRDYVWPLRSREAPGGRSPRKSKARPEKGAGSTDVSEQPQRRGGSKARRSSSGFSFGRSELVGLAVLLSGIAALAWALAGGTARPQYSAIQTTVLPPPAVPLLEGRRRQVFCVTNKTLNPIKYTVYWGDKQGRNYQIEAGSSIIHSSRFSGPPAVEFAQSDGPIQHVRDRGLNARISFGRSTSCDPNYSFEYLDADIARVSDYDRFGLYPDAPPAPEPAVGPNGDPGNSVNPSLNQL